MVDFCNSRPEFRFVECSNLNYKTPTRSTVTSEYFGAGTLHHLILKSILVERSNWKKAFMKLLDSLLVNSEPYRTCACQLPDAVDIDSFWSLLRAGKSQHTEVPTERFGFDTPWRAADPRRKWYSNFLEDYDNFDKVQGARMFGRTAAGWDGLTNRNRPEDAKMRKCEHATTLLRVANKRGNPPCHLLLMIEAKETWGLKTIAMMKLLSVPALLGAIALVKADYTGFHFINTTIPTDVTVGTEIFLEWTAKDYTGPFVLSVLAFNVTPKYYTPGPFGLIPAYDTASINLADPPSAAGGKFTWKAKPVDASGTWTSRQFLYQIDAGFPDQSSSSAGAFYLADAS
ncbi:hypothetical protein E0Z10_g5366 [Xylaria hypoxylon]|uniref:Beta-ketoacyl synthase-like N-terminal domain-containing protein n=1 Tax=Xylaria hypoxylon TaxID=37992 RepID=A0A4Z0YIV0_9PEZI|nr:hypothetical protein E0Z10_g5366 [Xylaria hypoxylon]